MKAKIGFNWFSERFGAWLFSLLVMSTPAMAQNEQQPNALDLLRNILKNSQSAAQNAPGAVQQAPGAFPSPVGMQRGIVPNACDLIQQNEQLTEFVKGQAAHGRREKNFGALGLGSKGLLQNWVEERLLNNNQLRTNLYAAVNECAFKLRDTDYFWLFVEYNKDLEPARKVFLPLTPKFIKKIDANGNIVEVQDESTRTDGAFWTRNALSYLPVPKLEISALFLPGGDKAVANFLPGLPTLVADFERKADEYEERLKARQAAAQQERQQKAEQERLKQKQEEDEKARLMALQRERQDKVNQAQEARNKANEDRMNRVFEQVKAGNYNEVVNCFELAMMFPGGDDLAPTINPQGFKGGGGTLVEYKDNPGVGFVQNDSGQFIKFTTSAKTKWVQMNSIRVSRPVRVFGRYVKNEDVRLANGSSQQAASIEAICISPKNGLMP